MACSYLWKQLWYLFYSEFLSRLTLSWILLVLAARGFSLVLAQEGVLAQDKTCIRFKWYSQLVVAVIHSQNIWIFMHSGYKKGLGHLGFVVTKSIWSDQLVSHTYFIVFHFLVKCYCNFDISPNMPREWSWLQACCSACPSSHATVLPCLVLFVKCNVTLMHD